MTRPGRTDITQELETLWPRIDEDARRTIRDLVTYLTMDDAQAQSILETLDARWPAGGSGTNRRESRAPGAAEERMQAILQQTPEQAAERATRLRTLFAQWDEEDSQRDPVEVAAEWEAFKADMNEAQALSGEIPLYS